MLEVCVTNKRILIEDLHIGYFTSIAGPATA